MTIHTSREVIIVTGASSGIGHAVALKFGSLSARVGLLARRRDRLENLAWEVERRGGEALVLTTDVSRRTQVEMAVQSIVERWGRIDVLVNNAAYRVSGSVEDCLVEDFEQQMAVNYLGAVYATKATLPFMRKQGSGSIVNISSISAKVYLPTDAAYCASKAALSAFTHSLRQELRGSRISVSLVCPGKAATEIFEKTVRRGAEDGEVAGPAMSADGVANLIIACVARPRREVIIPVRARLFASAYCIVPHLIESRYERLRRG